MKQLQKSDKTDGDDLRLLSPEEAKRPDLDDRLAAAGAAFYFGAPTALISWLLALAAAKSLHLQLPHYYYWFLGIWALLVICGFLFPRSTDEIFSNFWKHLMLGIGILVAVLIGARW